MGRARRHRPEHLAGKLLEIRHRLGLTQQKLLERLDYHESPLYLGQISHFESGRREPPLLLLLQYSRLAGVPMELLVDDEANLPERLPSS